MTISLPDRDLVRVLDLLVGGQQLIDRQLVLLGDLEQRVAGLDDIDLGGRSGRLGRRRRRADPLLGLGLATTPPPWSPPPPRRNTNGTEKRTIAATITASAARPTRGIDGSPIRVFRVGYASNRRGRSQAGPVTSRPGGVRRAWDTFCGAAGGTARRAARLLEAVAVGAGEGGRTLPVRPVLGQGALELVVRILVGSARPVRGPRRRNVLDPARGRQPRGRDHLVAARAGRARGQERWRVGRHGRRGRVGVGPRRRIGPVTMGVPLGAIVERHVLRLGIGRAARIGEPSAAPSARSRPRSGPDRDRRPRRRRVRARRSNHVLAPPRAAPSPGTWGRPRSRRQAVRLLMGDRPLGGPDLRVAAVAMIRDIRSFVPVVDERDEGTGGHAGVVGGPFRHRHR